MLTYWLPDHFGRKLYTLPDEYCSSGTHSLSLPLDTFFEPQNQSNVPQISCLRLDMSQWAPMEFSHVHVPWYLRKPVLWVICRPCIKVSLISRSNKYAVGSCRQCMLNWLPLRECIFIHERALERLMTNARTGLSTISTA